MTHRLVIVEPAEIDVEEIFDYIHARSAQGADARYRAFLACANEMLRHPFAFSIAPENAEFEFELRQALFKTKSGNPYRCVFTIVGDEVRILRVRGRGQAPLKATDFVKP